MKEIIMLIRPAKARITKLKLQELGFVAYTEQSVLGRGKQVGLAYPAADSDRAEKLGIPFLPKKLLTIFVQDEEVDQVIRIVTEANQTGDIGDGKIFVCPAEDVIRIRTDERGPQALTLAQSQEAFADASP